MHPDITRLSNITDHTKHREWLTDETRTIAELDEYLAHFSHLAEFHRMASAVRERMARKPHWTITPAFIVGLLAMIFAAIAAWPVIRDWFPKTPVVSSAPVVQSPSVPAGPLQLPTASPSASATSLSQPSPAVSAAAPTQQANLPVKPSSASHAPPAATPAARVDYTVIKRWNIPNGGEGKDIVISSALATDEGVRALGETLKQDTKNDRNAVVIIFDDIRAAKMSHNFEKRSKKELEVYDRHCLGEYWRNANTEFHRLTIHPVGIKGVWKEIDY
jgi:hypothetical protein